MIFVTVGAQMPFDRLVAAVDEWAVERGRRDVFAQVGASEYRPRALEAVPQLDPEAYRAKLAEADVVVGHAGMGTILTCLQMGKPLVVLPRRGALLETRNDHQVATAEHFRKRGGIQVAMDEAELRDCLDGAESLRAQAPISETASPELLAAVRNFIH